MRHPRCGRTNFGAPAASLVSWRKATLNAPLRQKRRRPSPLNCLRVGDTASVFCAPCHGLAGDGDGIIIEHGFPAPPSYHIDRLVAAPAQHFYDVMTDGYGVMFAYADGIDPHDRWAIAAYIRALQLSRRAKVAEIPDAAEHLR